MYLEQPDLYLREAIFLYYLEKGDYIKFLTDYKIESVRVHYIEHNNKMHKILIIEPKFLTNIAESSIVIGTGFYSRRFDIGNIKVIVNHNKDFENQFLKAYDEPYPGYYENDKPWINAKKKQKPKKRR